MPGPAPADRLRRELARALRDALLELTGRRRPCRRSASPPRACRARPRRACRRRRRGRAAPSACRRRASDRPCPAARRAAASPATTPPTRRRRRGDLVAGERQLVAAAGADAVERGEVLDAAVRAHVLDAEPRLVRELAEVHLEARASEVPSMKMFAPAQKMRGLEAGDDDARDLGVLEAEALQRVGELDVDAEIVGVELELVVGGAVRRPPGRPSPASPLARRTSIFQCLYWSGEVSNESDGDWVALVHGRECYYDLNARSNLCYALGRCPAEPGIWTSMAAAERRVEILKSAAAGFRRRGYHGASVDEIASALEMTKGQSLLLLPQQGRHPLRLSRILARHPAPPDAASVAGRIDPPGREAAQADSGLRAPDSRRVAGNGADARPGSALACRCSPR